MSKRKKETPPVVEVYWEDAESCSGWKDVSDSMSGVYCWSVGYVVAEDDKRIKLAATFSRGRPDQENATIQIPKGMIIRRRIIRR